MSFLSQNAKEKLLDEAQQHLQRHLTKDPAMPGFVRNFVSALVRIFWKDYVQELDETIFNAKATTGEGQEAELADLAAAPEIARGMLQVLVVEARNLRPAQGIGTNPYVRGMLGHQVRRSKTSWSTLSPFWKCLMEFPVVSTKGTLDLEIMSQAPLFGGDTRLGYVSLPLKEIIEEMTDTSDTSPVSRYRRETLAGAKQGEVVLILDYKPLERTEERGLFCGCLHRGRRGLTQFRAFFLYHYWPCDKSVFKMYLKEPFCILLLCLALNPIVMVRALFYTVLLLCLCIPWRPDEHQIVQFILACKGYAIFTDGFGRTLSGFFVYYSCIRAGTCHSGGGPGNGVSVVEVSLDLYQEVLIWFACFVLLPRTSRLGLRGAASEAATSDVADADAEAAEIVKKGGRINVLLKYNLVCFAFSLVLFGCLSARDLTETEHLDEAWMWRVPENFYWCRTLFGLLMFPFCMLLHPQVNKLLTHSTPTGYTRLGTLQRYRPRHHKKLRKASSDNIELSPLEHKEQPEQPQEEDSGFDSFGCFPPDPPADEQFKDNDFSRQLSWGSDRGRGADEDPVADLKAAIERLPCGSLALRTGELWFWAAGVGVGASVSVASFQIRTASCAVSLGLRAADASVSTALNVASYIPGSKLAFQVGGSAINCSQQIGTATLSASSGVVRRLPGGTATLDVLEQVLQTAGFLAAAAESREISAEDAPPLLLAGTERAETLKLEAAARLAEMLTRAEQLAEREAAEWKAEAAEWIAVRPEVSKIAQALKAQRPRFGVSLQRVVGAGDALYQSLMASARFCFIRLVTASNTLVRAFRRELVDLQRQAPGREPGWKGTWEAYSRLVCSAVCEACLELRPARLSLEGGKGGKHGAARFNESIPMRSMKDMVDSTSPKRRGSMQPACNDNVQPNLQRRNTVPAASSEDVKRISLDRSK